MPLESVGNVFKKHIVVIHNFHYLLSISKYVPDRQMNFYGVFMMKNRATNAIDIEMLKSLIKTYQINPIYKDEIYCYEALKEAIIAIELGNFGVGAVLVEKNTRNILSHSYNSVFYPHFRSDMHAEMKILTEYEEQQKSNSNKIYTNVILYITLEPCPMCLSRIINSGIKEVYFAAFDPIGGMVLKIDSLPQIWQTLLIGRIIQKASISTKLSQLSWEVFNFNRTTLNNKLENNIR